MNKKSTYTVTVVLFIAAVFFIFFRFKNDESRKEHTFYSLKERNAFLTKSPDWKSTRENASKYYQVLNDKPDDKKSLLGLTALFIKEARVTGDYMYYDKAAMQQVNKVLQSTPDDLEALTYKALIYLSQHHFADGLATAQKIEKLNNYYAFNYGILVDANVEMGDYKAAVSSADKMVSIRPDLQSYSRISYLREIHGDYAGAIDAMNSAVEAGMPGDEATEWARVQLGHLYENTGDMQRAEMQYTIALNERPGYAFALAGLGRVASFHKNYDKAVSYFQKADSSINDYSFKEQLASLYYKIGNKEKGKELIESVIEGMNADSKKGKEDESIGHYADRELATAYLMTGDYDKALEHALAEYNRRPNNIDVNGTVAWVYYKKGQPDNALSYIKTALRTGSKNPALLCQAGLIFIKNGEVTKGKTLIQEGLKNNANIEEDIRTEAAQSMKS